jgi:threonine/homoserine/homoserine lactone efflux protein
MNGLDLSLILSYVSVTFLLVITPGATTAVVVRSALAGGTRAGVATAAGAAVANSVIAIAVGLGLNVLLQRFPLILFAIRLAGACFLLWLACVNFGRAWRPGVTPLDSADRRAVREGPPFSQGLMVNLLNPPIITFYLVLPTFLRAGAGRGAYAVLAAIHVSMAFVVHTAWSVSFATLRTLLTRPVARRLLDAAAGVAMLAFSIWTMSKLWTV